MVRVSSPPQSWFKAVVCVSTPKKYPRSGYFLVIFYLIFHLLISIILKCILEMKKHSISKLAKHLLATRKADDLSNRITAPAPVKATVTIQNHRA